MEGVIYEMLYEGDKMSYRRCYTEDVHGKCYMEVLVM